MPSRFSGIRCIGTSLSLILTKGTPFPVKVMQREITNQTLRFLWRDGHSPGHPRHRITGAVQQCTIRALSHAFDDAARLEDAVEGSLRHSGGRLNQVVLSACLGYRTRGFGPHSFATLKSAQLWPLAPLYRGKRETIQSKAPMWS